LYIEKYRTKTEIFLLLMKKSLILLSSLFALALIVYTACSKDDIEELENLAYLTITPQGQLIAENQTIQFTAIATFTDSTTQDVTTKVNWQSTNESVVTIDANGLATGHAKGYAFVTASNGLTVGSSMLNVVNQGELGRNQVIQDYIDNYLGSENMNCGWTGNTANCDAGTISTVSYTRVIQRVNYFRRLVGLADDIVHEPSYSAKCQIAALMFKANSTINHYPPASWACYHADGAEAAGKSNIAYGFHTTSAVTAYIDDFGANNLAVGHRRWILYTKANAMGEGSTDNTEALWVFDWKPSAPAGTPEFVAYPAKGYMPAPLVFDRWHFGIPNASFGSATVTMVDNQGNNVSVNIIEQTQTGVGDNSIVWEPANINTTSPSDVKYTVTVSNITGAPQASYTYDVIIVQPTTKMKSEYELIREKDPNARVL